MEKNKLPQLSDLHHDLDTAFKNDQYKLLVNQPPHNSWIKKHPMAKTKNDQGNEVPATYIPIDKVEFLLDRIFQDWKCEVLREGTMFNSVYVTIRLHYKHPISGEWMFHDGVGAKDMQKDANSGGLNIENIKAAAVMMALPSAKSYAIKDAAEHIGKLFGKDLNRSHTIEFKGSYSDKQPESKPQPSQPVTEEDFEL